MWVSKLFSPYKPGKAMLSVGENEARLAERSFVRVSFLIPIGCEGELPVQLPYPISYPV